jgi:arylsulfatase
LPAGKATIRFEFVYDGGGTGKGGVGTLFVNGQKVASVGSNKPMLHVLSRRRRRRWYRRGTAVSAGYAVPFKFNGKIKKVTIELQPMTPATAIEADNGAEESGSEVGLSN